MFFSTKPALWLPGLELSRQSGCSQGLFWESVRGKKIKKNLCCIWEVDCRIISLSKHPCLLRCFSNCLNCFVQCCVCLELSGNSQIIRICERHIFGNTYWRTFSFQNMHFPSNAARACFGFFPVLSVHFCQCKACLKKKPLPAYGMLTQLLCY